MQERVDLVATPADNHLATAAHVQAEQIALTATGMVADDRHRTRFKLLAHGFERLAGHSGLWCY
jgi:hypothetical protein